jgi:hypothetical protein
MENNNLALSPEEMLLILNGLWDDDDDNDNDDDDESNRSSTTGNSTVSSTAIQLEAKLLSIENGADVTTDVMGDIKNADHADIDAILAKEMADLSVREREYVIQDIHGIAMETIVPEDDDDNDEFLQQRLRQLEECLSKIGDKPAYSRALYVSPEYVRNDKFRLLFLRAQLFNVPAAAQLMVSHFEEKQRLFGPDLLGRDILLEDLNDADRKELEKGAFQVLPVRDRAGRIVTCFQAAGILQEETSMNRVCGFVDWLVNLFLLYVFWVGAALVFVSECNSNRLMMTHPGNLYANKNCFSQQRSQWYTGMCTALNDEDIIKKGLVVVVMNVGSHRISKSTKHKKPFPTRLLRFTTVLTIS